MIIQRIKPYAIRLFTIAILTIAFSCCAFALEETKEFIVYPKVTLFSGRSDNSVSDGGFVVVEEDELSELLDADMVEWYEENYEVSFFDTETNEYEWQFDMTGAEAASEIGCFGQGVRVALIDSGIDADHPAFKNANISAGWNYAENSSDVTDMINHGTSVAGMILASTNRVKIDSLAPNVELVPIKCVSGASETIKMDDLCNSIYGAINDYDCDVINLSLGLSSSSTALKNAIQYAEDMGVTVVAAVGNNVTGSDNALQYPAAYESVIGVGSVGSTGKVSYFSRVNKSVFLLAPGERVLTAFLPEQDANDSSVWYYYGWGYGTSMSAPMVTAAAAVLKNADPSITTTELMDVLSATATQSEFDTVSGYDTSYGYGILNCEKALQTVLGDVSVFVSPTLYEDSGAAAYVYNNSDASYSGYLFAGEYKDNVLGNVEAQNISLTAKEKMKVSTKLSTDVSFFSFGKSSFKAPVSIDSVSFAKKADGKTLAMKVRISSEQKMDDINIMLSSKMPNEAVADTESVIHLGRTLDTSDGVYEGEITEECLKSVLGNSYGGSVVYVIVGSRSLQESAISTIVIEEPTEMETVAMSANASFVATSNIGEKILVSGIEYNDVIGSAVRGSTVTVTAPEVDGYVFRFWKRGSDDNGTYISSNPCYTFKLMTHTYLTAIYDKIEAEDAAVEFFNGNGEFVNFVSVETGTKFSEVEHPDVSLTGYDFTGWSTDAEKAITGVLRTVAQYSEKGKEIFGAVTVNGKAVENVSYGDKVVCGSENADFTCWKRDGKIISYSPEYTYYVWDGTVITESDDECTVKPLIFMDDYANDAFMIEYDAGGKLILETGILFGNSESITINSCSSKSTSQRENEHGQFTSKPAGSENFARGYLIYKDGDKFGVIYTDAVEK